MQTELQGQLDGITYSNEENGYTIARLKVRGHREPVTITGNFPSVSPGEILKLKGTWYNHPKYGQQFKVESYESVVPVTVEGIERYLGSGLIKGIGPVMAKRIVDAFGTEALNVIDGSVSRLKEIEGIGDKRIRIIEKAWAEQKEIKEVMIFLQNYDVGPALAAKIFNRYGQESIKFIRENPYRLATDISGVGFATADRIADSMGIVKDSPLRAEAGILYVLNQLATEGHVYYPYELLIQECREVLNIGREILVKAFAKLALKGNIVIEDINEEDFVENNKAVYLGKFYSSETGIADNLEKLLDTQKTLRHFDMDGAPGWVQKELGITLAENQIKAVKEALKNKVSVITGGPGTGKTTIINSIIKICNRLGQRALLAAPTGRAAKRMTEATEHEAKTIHRLLEFNPGEGRFKRDKKNPLRTDLIIIDETSMVDTILMHHLLKAVPVNASLVLVGDVDQLPSVGAGNVLKDIIDSGAIPAVKLTEIFRQSRESLIITNAHKVNTGEMPLLSFDKDSPRDFYFLELEQPEQIVERIISLCREKIPEKFKFDPVRDIQVLTAMNKGLLGVLNLNTELQKALNLSTGEPDELTRGGRLYRTGDKVMQVVNNYDRDVYNGDIGVITRINREELEITVDFDGRAVVYEYKDLDEIVLAYAVSVHKSQGSEYPAIVMPVHTQHYMLLQRNLLYTGITRGKKLVVIIGTKKAVAMAVRNNRPRKRYTYLKNRLSTTAHP